MTARFDHLVVAVADLDEAAARWRAAGLPAVRGGAHPVGTENVLVRGPRPAYVELIAAGRDEANPWLDRVRSSSGPISWAVAVDDVDAARAAAVTAGFDPGPVREGSRTTPEGDRVGWRMCDVGPGPYDGSLPFLIQWTMPMAPGPADGPVVQWVSLTPPDADRLADLLLAVGFVPSRHWPRRVFHEVGSAVGITLDPVGEPEAGSASWSMTWDDPDASPTSVTLRLPAGGLARHVLDGVAVTTCPDRRRFAAASLLPRVDEAYARLGGRSGDALGLRAEAWVEAVSAAGLGVIDVDRPVAALGNVEPSRVTRLHGPAATQPLTVVCGTHPSFHGTVVVVGIGDPAEVLDRHGVRGQGGPGASPEEELERIDDTFVLALSGGVYVVRAGKKVVTRALDGRASDGIFAEGEAERWLAEAADGRRTDGVLAGEPWL